MRITQNYNGKIETSVRHQVIDILREVLSDPDFALQLTARASARLKKSIRSKKARHYKPLEKILEKYGT